MSDEDLRYLADTHIILWSVSDDPRLNDRHREILRSDSLVYASAASVWEISIKRASGKLRAPGELASLLPRMGFQPLPISFEHAEAVAALPAIHADPFDRLLIAQARVEGLTVLSTDRHFPAYGIALA